MGGIIPSGQGARKAPGVTGLPADGTAGRRPPPQVAVRTGSIEYAGSVTNRAREGGRDGHEKRDRAGGAGAARLAGDAGGGQGRVVVRPGVGLALRSRLCPAGVLAVPLLDAATV